MCVVSTSPVTKKIVQRNRKTKLKQTLKVHPKENQFISCQQPVTLAWFKNMN